MTNHDSSTEKHAATSEQTIFKEEGQPPTGEKKPTAVGLEENIAGLLCYIFTPIIAIIFFIMEKENRFVRFHAMQAILLTGFFVVIAIGLGIFTAILSLIKLGIIGGLISGLFWILVGPLAFFLAVFCIYQAYQGKMFKVPVIGNMAEKYSVPK
ncbi:DUF4870 domain-containing protein [Sporosarcina sp. CAU 1771]